VTCLVSENTKGEKIYLELFAVKELRVKEREIDLDNTRFVIDSVVGTGVDRNIKFGFGHKGKYKIENLGHFYLY